MLQKRSIPCLFLYPLGKRHWHFSLSFLTSKNCSILFIACFFLNTLFRLFCSILICKDVSRMYVGSV